MPRFLNQDCVDIVVESAMDGYGAALQLRAVCRQFYVAVVNTTVLTHRRKFAASPGLIDGNVCDALWSIGPSPSPTQRPLNLCVVTLSGSFVTHIIVTRSCFLPLNSTARKKSGGKQVACDPAFLRRRCEEALLAIAEHCPMLEALDVSDCPATDAGIEAIAERCQNLHTLDVNNTELTDVGLSAVTAFARKLRSVRLENCEGVTQAGFEAMARHVPQLRYLRTSARFELGDLLVRAPLIESICLVWPSAVASARMEANLVAVGRHCGSHLKTLEVCWRNQESVVHTTAMGDVVCDVTAKLPRLRRLMFRGLRATDDAVAALAVCCPQLEELGIPSGREFSDVGLAYFAERCGASLRVLNISGTSTSYSLLFALALFCPSLEELDASWNKGVNDLGVRTLAKHCRKLRILGLSGTDIGNAGVAAIASNLSALERLDVSACVKVTAEGILQMTGDPTDDPEWPVSAKWKAGTVLVSRDVSRNAAVALTGFVHGR